MATATTTVQAHDELAALLARNLTFGPIPVAMPVAPVEEPKIVYSISQHYHHSAHAVKQAPVVPVQPQEVHMDMQQEQQEEQQKLLLQQTPEQQLVQNGIDPAALTPVQLALFKMSALDRREYLLQLWRICPPTRTAADYNVVAAGAAWDTMEAEMEKEIASSHMRVQQQQQQQHEEERQRLFRRQQEEAARSAAGSAQSSDGRWLQTTSQSYMEPYMASGYEELARREYVASGLAGAGDSGSTESSIPRSKYADDIASAHARSGVQLRYHATDPVYANRLSTSAAPSRASWPQQGQSAIDMENQYGALMAMRDGCEMEM